MPDNIPITRLITLRDLLNRIPYSRSHIYRLEKDGQFPRRVLVGRHRVGWVEREVEEWIQDRLSKRPVVHSAAPDKGSQE